MPLSGDCYMFSLATSAAIIYSGQCTEQCSQTEQWGYSLGVLLYKYCSQTEQCDYSLSGSCYTSVVSQCLLYWCPACCGNYQGIWSENMLCAKHPALEALQFDEHIGLDRLPVCSLYWVLGRCYSSCRGDKSLVHIGVYGSDSWWQQPTQWIVLSSWLCHTLQWYLNGRSCEPAEPSMHSCDCPCEICRRLYIERQKLRASPHLASPHLASVCSNWDCYILQ